MDTINSLGSDIAEEMLLALTTDEKPTENSVKIPKSDMCAYLKRNIDHLSIADRKSIGEILVINDMKNHMKTCSEGVIISLHNLSDIVIRQMYDLMQYKLNRPAIESVTNLVPF